MIRGLLAVPFLLVIVLFALSNQEAQRFVLWPTDLSVVLPLSLAVLGASLLFFVAGGLLAWGTVVRLRGRLRRMHRQVAVLEAQLTAARAQAEVLPAPAAGRELALSPPA